MANTITVNTRQFTYLDMDDHLLILAETLAGASRIAVEECEKRIEFTEHEAPLYVRCGDDTRLIYVSRIDRYTDPAGIQKNAVTLIFRKVTS